MRASNARTASGGRATSAAGIATAGAAPAAVAIDRRTARRYSQSSNAASGAVMAALASSTNGSVPVSQRVRDMATSVERRPGGYFRQRAWFRYVRPALKSTWLAGTRPGGEDAGKISYQGPSFSLTRARGAS